MTAATRRVDRGNGPVRLGRFTPGSPEWNEARKNRLGGSEIAAVLGLSKWDSHLSLWHRKRGDIDAKVENDEMTAGKYLEPAILAHFRDEHPHITVVSDGASYVHPDRPWQVATPDALAYHPDVAIDVDSLVEVKLALYPDEWGAPGTDEIPPYYLAQCRHYLDVFEAPRCWVHVFIGSCGEFRTYVVEPDEADQALMRAAGEAFIESLRTGTRPPIDGHDATYQAVRALHPDIEPVEVELPREAVVDYCAARRCLDDAKRTEQQARSVIADLMGNARKATFLGQTIATRQAKGDGTPFVVAARNLPLFEEQPA